MTEQDKQLLLKDLCTRLSYGVKMHANKTNFIIPLSKFAPLPQETPLNLFERIIDDRWLPYLRPMSGMTEEEKTKFHNFKYWIGKGDVEHCTINMVDWLNTYHFDYHGLIEKGLALEAPEGMYK